MLDIKPFVNGNFGGNMTTRLSDYFLVYKLKPAKKTGNFMGMKTFNHIFNNLKADYYQLFIHNFRSKELLLENVNNLKRIQKIKKYYTGGYYENIQDIIIQGGNQVTPLLEALALWTDYDLIKKYYKGFDIEKIDKTLWLWSTYYSKYYHIHERVTSKYSEKYNSQDKDLLSMNQRFNLLRFIWLLSRNEIPLVYKDGVLITDKYNMFKDVNVYNANSVEIAIKNIIKKLLNKNLSLDDFLYGKRWGHIFDSVIDVFPYLLVFGWTGYGYALNVYKFSPKSMGFEPVKYFKVERPFIGEKDYLNDIKFVNVNNSSDMTGLIYNLVVFWVDDEYMYFYAFYDRIIYKVKRSDVKFVRVEGNEYYFRIFGKLIRIELFTIKSFTGFVTHANDD